MDSHILGLTSYAQVNAHAQSATFFTSTKTTYVIAVLQTFNVLCLFWSINIRFGWKWCWLGPLSKGIGHSTTPICRSKKVLKKQLLQSHNVILLFIYWYLVFFNLNFLMFSYIETNWEPSHLVSWSSNSLKRLFQVFVELIDKNLLRKTDECCSCMLHFLCIFLH